MIIIFVEFIDQLIDYPINCSSLSNRHHHLFTLDRFSTKEGNFCDFLFVFLCTKPLLKKRLL